MRKYLLVPFVSMVFIACGNEGGETASSKDTASVSNNVGVISTEEVDSSGIDSSIANLKVAINNTGKTIKLSFNDFILQLVTSNALDEADQTSNSSIAIYGTVNGLPTEALLKLNTNYVGSEITVMVLKNEQVVGQSKTFTIKNLKAVNFGEITTN